jgi:hypothetical protein
MAMLRTRAALTPAAHARARDRLLDKAARLPPPRPMPLLSRAVLALAALWHDDRHIAHHAHLLRGAPCHFNIDRYSSMRLILNAY